MIHSIFFEYLSKSIPREGGFCALLFARAVSIDHDATGLNLLLGSDEGFSCIDRRSSAPEAVQAFANQSLSLQELMDPRVPSDTSPTRLGPSVAFTYTLANHGPSPLVGAKVRARVGIRQVSSLRFPKTLRRSHGRCGREVCPRMHSRPIPDAVTCLTQATGPTCVRF